MNFFMKMFIWNNHKSSFNHVYKLKRSLYGLWQALKAWFSRLTYQVITIGFVSSKVDASLYILYHETVHIIILIYVDDIIITGSNTIIINHQLLFMLSTVFPTKDLGLVSFFLGVETLYHGPNILLTQRKYIINLFRKVNMDKAKSYATPMSTNTYLSKYDYSDSSLYKSIVGGPHYLGFTSLDIEYNVYCVNKFMYQLKDTH